MTNLLKQYIAIIRIHSESSKRPIRIRIRITSKPHPYSISTRFENMETEVVRALSDPFPPLESDQTYTMAPFGVPPLCGSAPGADGAVVKIRGAAEQVLCRSLNFKELVDY